MCVLKFGGHSCSDQNVSRLGAHLPAKTNWPRAGFQLTTDTGTQHEHHLAAEVQQHECILQLYARHMHAYTQKFART